MIKVENFGESWIDLEFDFPCEIHHCTPRAQPDRNRFSVLTHYTEPRPLKWPVEKVREYHGLFDLILTNEESLFDLPNVKFSLFGGCWIQELPKLKRFDLSFLYSNGIGSEQYFQGYRDRRELWGRRNEIVLQQSFYTSTMRPPVGIDDLMPFPSSTKDILFESMFSVIIENDYQKHFFTEKIIDSLRAFTVPIYLGCENIDSYFDARGILSVKSVSELIDVCNGLTVNDYWRRMDFLAENYRRAANYIDVLGSMRKSIEDKFKVSDSRNWANAGG